MFVAGIPKPRSKFTKFYYYSLRILGPLLILFLSLGFPLIYIISFYKLHYKSITDNITRNQCFMLFAILFFPSIMVIISLGYTVLGDPGTTKESIRRYKNKGGFITQQFLDSLPRCTKCGLPKPPRCHHCRVCGRCHLRMDHHCPSIGTCIALRNHQPFLVMLRWGSIEAFLYFIVAIVCSCAAKTMEEKFFNIISAISLILVFFFILSFYSKLMKKVSDNATTLEEMSGEYGKYDIGKEENIKQMFGSGKFRYIIPKYPAMTGFEWALDEYCRNHSNSDNVNQPIFPTI